MAEKGRWLLTYRHGLFFVSATTESRRPLQLAICRYLKEKKVAISSTQIEFFTSCFFMSILSYSNYVLKKYVALLLGKKNTMMWSVSCVKLYFFLTSLWSLPAQFKIVEVSKIYSQEWYNCSRTVMIQWNHHLNWPTAPIACLSLRWIKTHNNLETEKWELTFIIKSLWKLAVNVWLPIFTP